MRIISGILKGRRLCHFSTSTIRPMTDRVKTSVFDTLVSRRDLCFDRVLDLFSGTGNLAFEALSRGSKEVTLVDSSRKSIQIIKKNAQILRICSPLRVEKKDVFRFLSSYEGEGFDLIFADPPFEKKLGQKILDHLKTSQVLKEGSLFVLEISAFEKVPSCGESYHSFTQKGFGDKKVLFYRFEKGERNRSGKDKGGKNEV